MKVAFRIVSWFNDTMQKKHIITLAGKLGSGKSSTGKLVAQLLNYQHTSTGDFMRAMAEERGVTLGDLQKIAETDTSIDKAIDAKSIELRDKENIIIDSRLAFHFIPESFKVFLELAPEIAAQRILKDKENNPSRHNESSDAFETPEQIVKAITERLESERKRYKDIYGIEDQTDHANFDLVINTATIPLPEVASTIIEKYNEWLNS